MTRDKRKDRVSNIVFRVDSSIQIGSGHVMRCLTLARELADRGAAVVFVCKDLPGNLIARIEHSGFDVRRLTATGIEDDYSDAIETLASLRALNCDWLVVDHYSLSAQWERQLWQRTQRILVIDDLLDRSHDCDILLDQNWRGMEGTQSSRLSLPEYCRRLSGPRYALLQPEYALFRKRMRRRRDPAQRVMVFFGGSDTTDETGKALAALSLPEFAHLSVDVVIGANYVERDALISKVQARPGTTLHENLPNLTGLMMQADFAIGAGGTTTWERICLDLYALVTTLAANQEPSTEALAKAGFVHWIGRSTDTTCATYRDALHEGMKGFADKAPIVDGFGTKRVAELIMPTNSNRLNLRLAQSQDAISFFDWRNEPVTRAMSFAAEPISWERHVEWFERKLSDDNAILYVAEVNGLPIGQARIDLESHEAVLSYSIDPLVRARGWGRWLVREAVVQTQQLHSVGFIANVKSENAASRKIFASLGWSETIHGDGDLVYRLSPDRCLEAEQ